MSHDILKCGPRPLALLAVACLWAVGTLSTALAGEAGGEISAEFPYQSRYVEVLGSDMHYVEEGEGDPILLLHGQPTSSYLWRNVIPHLSDRARVIAPDNIGFGKSDRPDIDYSYANHVSYIEGFIEALGLEDVTVVGHDWGSAFALDYAARHPDNVKAVALLEAIMAPVFPAAGYDDLPPMLEKFFTTLRSEQGTRLMVEQNYFVEKALPDMVMRELGEAEMDAYRAPFETRESRRRVIVPWPNQIPIGNRPPHTTRVIDSYNTWLTTTDKPKLLLYAKPGALNGPAVAEWLVKHASNVETAYVGRGLHYVQEDQPEAIGRAIADWYRRLPD